MMDKDELDALTQLFLSCKDLDEDEVREALRGFGYEVERGVGDRVHTNGLDWPDRAQENTR